jgi:hypothetical protein
MKLLGILLTACVVIAAAQAIMAVLAILLVAGVIFGLFVCPREMISLIFLLALIGVFQVQPLACLVVVALMIIAKLISSRKS